MNKNVVMDYGYNNDTSKIITKFDIIDKPIKNYNNFSA